MASKSLGTLTLDLVAKVGGFVAGMDKAERSSEKWRKQVEKSATAAGAAVGAAAAVAAGAMAVWVKSSVTQAAELHKLAQVASAGTTEFQKFAAGARTVGIENDKLSDILKDVNDRVGDFLTTGGGPMKDFFEQVAPKVGVTAEQFRNLSGPQALGLYVDTLQKAGANQQEMTFFLEAMASDATALLPLLQDGAAGMRGLGDEAERLGLILSEETIQQAKQFNEDLDVLGRVAGSVGQSVAAELLPELGNLTEALRDPETIQAAVAMAKGVTSAFTDIIAAARETVGFIKWASESAAAYLHGAAPDDLVRREKEIVSELEASNNKLRELASEIERPRALRINPFQSTPELESEYSAMLGRIKGLEKARDALYAKPLPSTVAPQEPVTGAGSPKGLGSGLGIDLSAPEKAKAASKAADDAQKAAQKASDAIVSQVTALQLQADMLGKSADEQMLYKLAMDGATESQLVQAKAALDSVSSFEAMTEAKQKAAEEQARINEEAQGIADSLLGEEEQILASYERRRQIILDNTKITGEAQAKLLSELEERKNEDLLEINGSYWERYLEAAEESLQSFDELAGSVVENFSSQFGDAFEAMVFDAQTLEEAVSGMAEGMARSVVNALGQMAAQWLAYQLVQMLVGKTTQTGAATAMASNAAAASIQAGINAFASTAAIPIVGPAAAPAAMAAAIAATGPMAASVSALAMGGLAGMAHDGIDSVPQTGTWLLEKGERVTTAQTSARLDKTLSDIQSSRAAGSDGRPIYINNSFPNVTNAREARQSAAGASRSLARAVQSAGRYT